MSHAMRVAVHRRVIAPRITASALCALSMRAYIDLTIAKALCGFGDVEFWGRSLMLCFGPTHRKGRDEWGTPIRTVRQQTIEGLGSAPTPCGGGGLLRPLRG